jgi:surface antigen
MWNAQAAWVPTWSTAANGAIIAFRWSGYNPYYGHVGIVSEVWDDYIIVKDMNYRRFNEVTVRKISKNDRSIRWYIYAN